MAALLDRMKRNPVGDWSIRDVETVCRDHGLACTPPSGGGSHYKISHSSQREILTVPFRRLIKPVYIRKLVRFIEAAGASHGKS